MPKASVKLLQRQKPRVVDSGRKVIYRKENWDTNPREKVKGGGGTTLEAETRVGNYEFTNCSVIAHVVHPHRFPSNSFNEWLAFRAC